MIKSFKCKETGRIFYDIYSRKFDSIDKIARRKLEMLEVAKVLDDLMYPPGNRLEKLKGDRIGQLSIRINKKFRLCFIWDGENAHEVEIIDYH